MYQSARPPFYSGAQILSGRWRILFPKRLPKARHKLGIRARAFANATDCALIEQQVRMGGRELADYSIDKLEVGSFRLIELETLPAI
jgi:ribosomal protein S6